jgi:hypothetical protein
VKSAPYSAIAFLDRNELLFGTNVAAALPPSTSPVQLGDAAIASHEQAVPDSRVDAAQQNVELMDLRRVLLIGHGGQSVVAEKLVRQHAVFPGLLRNRRLSMYN